MASLRADIEAIYRAAIDRVRADHAVSANLEVDRHGVLRVGGESVDPGPDGVYLIALGKASVTMADAAADLLGDLLRAGIAVTKTEAGAKSQRIDVLSGAHPVPDGRSLAAGERVLHFAGTIPDGAVVLCLISGGGSALVEALRDGVSLDDLRSVTERLLRSGASIHELNAVRSRLSRIKAGGLLQALAGRSVHNLIVSDVLGDDVHTIASGPTVPARDADAEAVLARYGIDFALPEPVDRSEIEKPPTHIIASLSMALDAAQSAAVERGYRPVVLTRSLTGEAREVAGALASIIADSAEGRTSFGPPTCLLAGGETTVTVQGDGVGGRNTEAALAAALRLADIEDCAVGFLATDGDDGATGVAGAIVDGSTVDADNRLAAERALVSNDSYTLLHALGATFDAGPTRTNVNDLFIGLVGD